MNQKKTVKIGIIGSGLRMRRVLKLVLEEAANRIAVAAVCDPDPQAIDETAQLVNARPKVYQSASDLVSDPEIEWVFIGSPNYEHRNHAVSALHAGKHVFCEKPLATSLEDCLAIRNAVRESGRVFSFGLVLRYSPHYQKIHQLLESGAIGKLVSFEFNETINFNHGGYIFGGWRRNKDMAGSHMLEKCCHDMDIANWLTGSRPVLVASLAGKDVFRPQNRNLMDKAGTDENGHRAYQTWMPMGKETDPFAEGASIMDNQVAILQYANGVRATFHANSNTAFHERRFYMCGTEGTLRADVISGVIEVQRIGFDVPREVFTTRVATDGHGGGDTVMAKGLCNTLLNGAAPLATVDDGLRSCAAVFGIDKAQESKSLYCMKPIWDRVDAVTLPALV